MAKPVILYFYIETPTEEDRAIAKAAGAMLRNAAAFRSGEDFVERCDGVMGYPPREYAERFKAHALLSDDMGAAFGGKTFAIESIALDDDPPAPKEPGTAAIGRAYCIKLAGGQWEIIDKDGNRLPEPCSRATAYRRVKEMNGE